MNKDSSDSGEAAGTGSCPADPALGSGANEWACTHDNVTGRTWEVKTDDNGLRDKDHGYSWYDTNPATNGFNPGKQDGGICFDDANRDCDTQGYTQDVNTTALCGFSDWRMPTREELRSIVDYEVGLPAIDTAFFPNTGAFFWSASGFTGSSIFAWLLNFISGNDDLNDKDVARQIRLVRGGLSLLPGPGQAPCNASLPEATPTTDFTVKGDGTAVHNKTGLMWMRCELEQTWNGTGCDDPLSFMGHTCTDALTAVNTSTFAGFDDWRLSNIKELASIVEIQCINPSINATVFPNTPSLFFWSATGLAGDLDLAWFLDFDDGNDDIDFKINAGRVRWVRGGQLFDAFDGTLLGARAASRQQAAAARDHPDAVVSW